MTVATKPDMLKPDAAKPDAAKPDAAKSDGVISACEETTWSVLDGKCVSGNARKARVVRVPTNRPAIAAIPLGRAAAAPVSATTPTAPAVAGAPRGAKGGLSKSEQAKSEQAAPDAAASAVASDASQQPAAGSKKPQKTAHSQNRRREQGKDGPSWREVRADPQAARGPATGPDFRPGPFGGFFSLFR